MRRLYLLYMKAALASCLVMFGIKTTYAQTPEGVAVKRDSYTCSSAEITYPEGVATSEDPLRGGRFAGEVTICMVELTMHEDSLLLKMELRVSGEAVGRRQSWAVIPQLYTVEGDSPMQITFPYALINGQIREQLYKRKLKFGNKVLLLNQPGIKTYISRQSAEANDMLLHYSVRVPYQQWMDTARLRLHTVLISPAGKRQLLTIENVGQMAKRVSHVPYAVKPRVNFTKPAPERQQAFLDFQEGSSVIIPTFRRNPEELDKIADAISKAKNDPGVQITGLFVDGYASPDGSYILNERLARQRVQTLVDYMVKTYGLDRQLFRINSVAEDWEGLSDLIKASTISESEEILSIIQQVGVFEGREAALMRLDGGRTYRLLKTDFFPHLRRVEYQIELAVNDEADESRAETMINKAALMIDRGDHVGASQLLEHVGNDTRALNNKGVCLMMEGELDKAAECFHKAAEQGVEEAAHNLDELRKKREDNEKIKQHRRE